MKTFEERYTEWIDGELRGPALTAFEAELARRAQAGEAQADKAGAASLRALLREHLQAPELSNTEFFNHQLREEIERGRAAEARLTVPRQTPARSWWNFVRFGGLATAAVVFVAAALYYGMMPNPTENGSNTAAVRPTIRAAAPEAALPQPTAAPVQPSSGPMELVKLEASEPDLQARALDESTSATPLRYKAPNKDQHVQVLWMNGLEYQGEEPAEAAPAPSAAQEAAPR